MALSSFNIFPSVIIDGGVFKLRRDPEVTSAKIFMNDSIPIKEKMIVVRDSEEVVWDHLYAYAAMLKKTPILEKNPLLFIFKLTS